MTASAPPIKSARLHSLLGGLQSALSRRGHSLLEAIIAMFIFGGAIILVVSSADTVLQSGGKANREATAVFVAKSQMAEVRKWMQTNPNFAGWSSYPGAGNWYSASEAAGYEVRVTLKAHQTMTPSKTSETIVDPTQQRLMNSSLVRVRVEVRYGSNRPYQLDSLIADSRRKWRVNKPIVISAASSEPASLAKGANIDFTVVGYDENDKAIDDLKFTWSIIPGGSMGMFKTPEWRDGHAATFIHQVPKIPPPGFAYATPGAVWVAATARFCGQERVGTFLLDLQ